MKLFRNLSQKVNKVATIATGVGTGLILTATHSFAANADLDTATTSLTTGVTDMKTNALVIIAAVIAVIVVVFGIGWLINIVKRNMSKA